MDFFSDDFKKHLSSIDWFLVITVLAAMAYGFVLIKSATNIMPYLNPPENQMRNLITQIVAAIGGLIFVFILSKSDYDHMVKYAKALYVIAVILMVTTLIFGTGDVETGNKNWIRIPIINVGGQPSEIVKILFIMTFAKHLDSVKDNIDRPKNMVMLLLHFGGIVGLVLAQKDLGTALIFVIIFLTMCFAAGVSLWYFLAGAFIAVASSPLIWAWMGDDYQKRILAGFNPMIDPEGKGYQALRSMRAIGSGGLFGSGYQKGYMTQGGRVPKQWTDFIFSAAGEEFGFIGAILVLLLLTLIIGRIFYISRSARNNTGSLMCVGVMAIFISQTIENIGMCLGMLPVIGITLPFFSYGGSSILGSLMAVGLVLSVNSRKNIYYFARDENLDRF